MHELLVVGLVSGLCFVVAMSAVAYLYFLDREPKTLEQWVARHAEVLNSFHTMIWAMSIDRRAVFFNQAWYEFRGRSPEQELAQGWLEGFHEEDRERLLPVLLQGIANRHGYTMEHRIRDAQGNFRWVVSSAEPCFDHNGTFWGFIGNTHDVNDEKIHQRDLQTLASIVGDSEDAIITLDLNGKIKSWNFGATKIYGYSEDEAVGQIIFELLGYNQKDRTYESNLLDCLNADIPVNVFEAVRWAKSGNEVWVSVCLSAIRDAEGELIAISNITRDVTQKRKTEEQLRISEAKYRNITETINEGILSLDRESKTTYVNPHLAEIFGFQQGEMLNKHIDQFIFKEDYYDVFSYFDRAQHSDAGIRELRLKGNGNESVWALVSARPMLDENGRKVGLIAGVTDITDRRKSEEEARRLYEMIQASPDLYATFSSDFKPMFLSKPTVEKFGWTTEFERIHDFFGASFQDMLEGDIFDYAKKHGVWEGNVQLKNLFDWTEFPARCALMVQKNPNGTVKNYALVAQDLTEQQRAASEIERQRAKFVASSRMASLGEMAAGLAHEVNNPLAIIQGFARQLERDISKDRFDRDRWIKAISNILLTTDRIAKIVSGLRTFARVGDTDPLDTVPVAQIVKDSTALYLSKLIDNGVRVEIAEIPEDLLLECRSTQISQVLLNLFSNSFDAIAEKEDKWIRLECESDGETLCIRLVDSGDRIPDEVAEKLMQPFFTTKEVGKGTGLGLSVSAGVIRGHGGTFIFDRSAVNTTFVIKIPLRQTLTTKIEEAA